MNTPMTIDEAITILKGHNAWRRGDDSDMLNPKLVGQAIDVVVAHYESLTAQQPRNPT